MAIQSKAQVVWQGDLVHGKGDVTAGTDAFTQVPISWAARTERPDGKTSPEELLAAAHASCYAMALSATLSRRRTPPAKLDVSAVCTFDKVGDAFKVTTLELTVRGTVPDLNEADFEDAAKIAEQTCPISNAVRGNITIRLNAALEETAVHT